VTTASFVKQNDFYEILNQSKENTKPYYEGAELVMVTEYRLLNNTSDKTGEIVIQANPDKLIELLVNDDSNSLVDPAYVQDFLLTYRLFIDAPTFISNKLCEWFEQSSNSLILSSLASANLKKKVYRIVLE
jgi:hypothetical protein